MEHIDFYKQQAKHFLEDYKSRSFNDTEGFFEYHPRFFHDIDNLILEFEIDEKAPFSLMKAQHLIANLAGFYKWNELIKASQSRLELGRLLIEHRKEYEKRKGEPLLESWEFYEETNLSDEKIDDEFKLEVFKAVFLDDLDDKKRKAQYAILDFSKDLIAQDMVRKVMKKKDCSAEKAILSSITQKNCICVLTNGWVDIALSLWGHDNPNAEKETLENPTLDIKFTKDKEYLLGCIMENKDVSLRKAVLYCMLFSLEKLGYHI